MGEVLQTRNSFESSQLNLFHFGGISDSQNFLNFLEGELPSLRAEISGIFFCGGGINVNGYVRFFFFFFREFLLKTVNAKLLTVTPTMHAQKKW